MPWNEICLESRVATLSVTYAASYATVQSLLQNHSVASSVQNSIEGVPHFLLWRTRNVISHNTTRHVTLCRYCSMYTRMLAKEFVRRKIILYSGGTSWPVHHCFMRTCEIGHGGQAGEADVVCGAPVPRLCACLPEPCGGGCCVGQGVPLNSAEAN